MKVKIGDEELEAIASAKTLMVYEQEFGSDLIQDLFGRAVIRKPEEGEDVLMVFDYTATNWTAALKALWACLRTASDSVPPFKEWIADLPDVNLMEVTGALYPEVQRRLFRAVDSPAEAEAQE